MKKALSILLSLIMVLTMLPTFAITAYADRVITPESNTANDIWLTKDGVLHWTATMGASNYTIKLYPHPSNSVIKTITVDSSVTSYNLIDALDSERYEQRDYRIEINKHTAFLFTYASPFEKLTAPTDLKWDGNVAIWEPVLNAEKYGVYIYNSAGKYVTYLTTKETFLNLAEYAPEDGWCFSVYASGNGYRDSEMNESPRKNGGAMIITPEINSTNDVWLTKDGVLHWKSNGTSKSTIKLFQHPSNSVLKTITVDPYITEYDLFAVLDSERYEQRDYRVEVSNHGALIITYVSPYEKLTAPTNLFWSGKVALWNPVPNAEKYGVFIYDSAGKYVNHISTKDTFLNLAEYAPEDGWSFCVYASGSGYRDSEMNESPRKVGKIRTITLNGTIRPGNVLSDNGPLTISASGIDIASFVYSKNGKILLTNTKATYGNYSCTVNLFADKDHYFSYATALYFNGDLYKPTNIINNGEIAVFEIPNIYVECPHASSIWGYNTEKHWLLCPTCGGKYAEGYHNYSESISGSTITYTCTECGFKKEGKVAETRTAIYRPYIDFGTAMVGDAIPTTVKLDYANTRSGSEKYYNYATVQSVKYSTTGTFKNAKTTVTVVLKANKDYYFESIALPTPVSSCYFQYTRESVNVSEDGTTLTAVFSFTPYTTADVTLTLPAEFSAGKTYAEIAKEVQFKVNGVAAKDYSVSIKKAGESSWTISNISNGVVSEQYMYESVIEPNTEYELGVNSNINGTYAKSLTITNKNVAVITDSYYGEAVARVNANYTSVEGHNYDAGTITKQATCTEDGSITFKCTDTGCKSTKTMVIPKKGHQATTAYEIPATCVDEGKTAGTVCLRCDTVLSGRKPIAPTGEHYYSIIIAPEVKPTCTKDGKEAIKRCAYCMDTIGGGVLKATGVHNYSTAWSTDSTNHWHACSCGAKKSSAAHTFKTTVTKATMSADGKKVTKCTICGYVKSSVVIKKPSTVTLSTSKYTYDGKVKKPSVTVKDNNGKTISSSNYTVTYPSGRKNVGKYTYKLTFKGDYTGTKSVSFTIVPKSTSISSLTAASKAFTVKWKKQATQTTGYQIQIATDSKFTKGLKSYIVTKNSTVSKKITSLSAKKKYYVKIRTYKTVSGTRYYSSWSSVKSITTK